LLNEYQLPAALLGTGEEYTRIADLKALKKTLILPVELPEKPDISTVADEINIELSDLRHWERAATNLKALEDARIEFALSSAKLEKSDDFLKNLKVYIAAGLSKETAIKALTETPARLLKMNNILGSLENGKLANFVISNGDLFEGDHSVLATVVRGKINEFQDLDDLDLRANYTFSLNGVDLSLAISGTADKETIELELFGKKLKSKIINQSANELSFSFSADTANFTGDYKFSGRYIEENKLFKGYLINEQLEREYLAITKVSDFIEDVKKKDENDSDLSIISKLTYPNIGFGNLEKKKVETVLYKNFTIWTSEKNFELKDTDLLTENGKIREIGKNLSAPSSAKVIDGKGKYLTTGIIDQHSHIGISGGFNEGHSISAEVRIADVVDAEDISIYRQLAGGVTSSQLLHGSADPIGGQSQVIKLRWGLSSEELKFKKSAQNIKFALGENVKRSRASQNTRYPNTRMGVETIMRDAFQAAIEYRDEWKRYNDLGSSDKRKTISPKKDLQKDVLLDILEGRTFVHCHSYVQSEIIMLMRLAEEFGFRVHTFTHILEGYKVADEMKKHGAMASTFSDWWAYKYEVKDAMSYNGALMNEKGLVVSFNSDDDELGRRLNVEAAKSIVHGNMSIEDAWKTVTINPAKQLQVEKYTGSIKEGKDADIVIWNGNPLSTYSKVESVWIDGINYFSLEEDLAKREALQKEKMKLIKKVKSDKSSKASKKPMKKMKNYYKCTEFHDYSLNGGLHE
jgi:imidazolonepropionase-like amidohydrolase